MAETESIVLEVDLDVGKLEDSVIDLHAGLKEMQTVFNNMLHAIASGFDGNAKALQRVESGVQRAGKETAEAVKNTVGTMTASIGGVASQLDKIAHSVTDLGKLVEGDPVANAVSFASDFTGIFSNLKSVFGDANKGSNNREQKEGHSNKETRTPDVTTASTAMTVAPKKDVPEENVPRANPKIPIQLPGPVDSNWNVEDTSNLVNHLTAQMGGLGSSGAGIGAVAEALEHMRQKLVETANSWVELARVKKEDLATDVQKVATYVGEYAKGFASMAAGLASNAAAWVKNTAALVASTAAQWAQTAATTAWQGICVAATAVTTAFGAAMQFLTSPIGIAVTAIAGVIAVAALLVANWDTVVAKTKEVWGFVQQKLTEFGGYMTGVFAKDWSEQFGAFGHVLNGFFTNVKNIWESVKGIFGGIITFITNVFSGNWEKAWEGIKTVFSGVWNGLTAAIKTPINGMIGMVNMLISAVCSGVNGVIQVLNGLQFTIPDWVPVLGGNSYGFHIQPLETPQIPYLAKGAVLPANRPFLAVVGDQRHGTNVETPLTTIQEAVGVVMHDHIAAMMAGFEALLEEQRALRALVADIGIGDTVIGQATERYNRKMAVVRGG